MFKNIAAILISLAALACSPATGQQLGDLLNDGDSVWTNQIIPANPTDQPGLLKGNGVSLTPDGSSVVVTSVGGTVTSFDALTGLFEWEYLPTAAEGSILRTTSKVVFTTENAAEPYMVYSVVEGIMTSVTRVIALDMAGNELWISSDLEGTAAGSPVVSNDGHYVFLTHNAVSKSIGYFTALWAASNGTTFYSASDEDAPFAPPGIFHNPAEGFYDGSNGVGNRNDVIMWANAVKPDATEIGTGSTFVFQFPVGFADTSDGVGFLVLGDVERDFLGETAPVITNEGRSAYYAVSRSGFVCWIGEQGLPREYFSRGPAATLGFTRNSGFRGQPVFASPALSSDTAQPAVFGGTASTEFIRMDHDFSNPQTITTSSHIMAEAKVDPGDRTVYFVELTGMLHSVDFNNLQNRWSFDLGFSVEGDMAMSADGSVLYIGDTRGMITAVKVAEIAPTPEPTTSPTSVASESPSSAPIVPTLPPSAVPTGLPSSTPTKAPSTDEPTASPTKAPVEEEVTNPPVATPAPEAATSEAPSEEVVDDSSASRTCFFSSIILAAACLLV
mmetsp:Transcript_12023/g.18960  ORF Transcript_12023/g.18960 Transcript_12023/m.18960 type:complete len:558 (+) Transcript_12023:90-1763(+)|eukprot:CAMPEP_0116998292 /NCGR_PEP_ID=MMETSP0472-20121206/1418_1 /TAXON_ID=693140 ORGANISM="Tiarina fusus, Strain LIS" /NCGR_SAMPLE_ID=MMETSP0472 /ASSEMBLY_ACC=CAM_ASM_000603 /LENGTH=557 /DNA_ID=CAMNT_0004697407 /DNA_START=90 /DNA_END=1763 /DNA_ORIENTATION=+